jgi:hypothetical protein
MFNSRFMPTMKPIVKAAEGMARTSLGAIGVMPKRSPMVTGGIQSSGMSRAVAPYNTGGMGSAIRNNMNNIASPINGSQNQMRPVVAKNMFRSMFNA